ncbi:MAG TPA: FHA domain-containing protein [Gemmatimonadaceae bacterium]|nr:FHA domain-containing protein [Gemmatimonadaceae bacterium]
MTERYLVHHFERRAYPLRQQLFTVGRDADSDLVVREPTVSRTHARVTLEGEDAILESLGPTGTRVNGEQVLTPRKLEPGDQILIGTAKLTFTSAALPTGFTVVNAGKHPPSDPDTKRTTIRTPLLRTAETLAARPARLDRTWILGALLVLAVVFFVFTRG